MSKTFKTPPAPDVSNLNSAGRLDDMDTEGVDVHVIIPGTFANAATALDAELATELYEAYHRYVAEYCSVDIDRLKATILPAGTRPWGRRGDRGQAGTRAVGRRGQRHPPRGGAGGRPGPRPHLGRTRRARPSPAAPFLLL